MREVTPSVVMFDFETNGFSASKDVPVQLAYAVYGGGGYYNPVAKNFFFEVSDKVLYDLRHPRGMKLLEAWLTSKRYEIEEVRQEIMADFNTAGVLMAHNIKFDESFYKYHIGPLNNAFRHCTMNRNTKTGWCKDKRGHNKPPKLCELMEHFKITTKQIEKKAITAFNTDPNSTQYHDARFDVAALMLYYERHMCV